MSEFKDWGDNFQTPLHICRYMASFLPKNAGSILEPTPGKGQLVSVLEEYGAVQAPENFDSVTSGDFNYVVMNPPFTPMKKGYEILYKVMGMSDNIICLMPYLTIINSEKRTNDIFNFGLKSITHLPRNVFKGSRVQTCILEMEKGYSGETIFRNLADYNL